jgi:hypothetical protein
MHKSFKLFLLFGLMAVATPSFGQIHLGINFGPPPMRVEVRGPAPSPTSVWIGGYYTYDAGRGDYIWNRGRWDEPPQSHAKWVAPHYKAHNDHFDYYEGKWNKQGKSDHGKEH